MPLVSMKVSFKSFLLFVIASLLMIFLAVSLIPYVSGKSHWYISFLALGFPFITAIMLLALLVLIIKRSKWFILPLAFVAIGWQQISVICRVGFKRDFTMEKPPRSLRILSWNVAKWDAPNKFTKGGKSYREDMMLMIRNYNADVLCLQEFFESPRSVHHKSNIRELKAMGFTYSYFVPRLNLWDSLYTGSIIVSKFPIKDSVKFMNASNHSEGMSYVDVEIQRHTFRVIVAKLESVGFSKEDYTSLEQLKKGHFSAFNGVKTIIRKFKYSYPTRFNQAEMAEEVVNNSPYPVIFCAHLDDVPNSASYFTAKGKLKDAFLEKGSGFGKTWSLLSPTLRISYIFIDPLMKVIQFTTIPAPYSDHYAIVADIDPS